MELRKDYVLERWVYYSPERGRRPKEFLDSKNENHQSCFFCPGMESQTPPEIGRTGDKDWKIRWFDNKFAAVSQTGNVKTVKSGLFTHAAAYGKHEVIVESPRHDIQLWDLSENEILELLQVYKKRIVELHKRKNISYVMIFKNHGANGGTSLAHTHSQVIATAIVPPLVKDETSASIKNGTCIFCRVITAESKSDRLCFENDSFISFAPYASRFNYETWIFPKRHVRKIEDLWDNEMVDFARILKMTLVKLKELGADFNFYLHYAPKRGKLHLHMEVAPRESVWAGFELGSGATINSVMPESAASFYRK